MNPDLLILCATLVEISPFLTRCPGSSRQLTRSGPTLFSGRIRHKTYDLLITGPGVFNAAHALTVYLEQFTPALILQTGIAGIFEETGLSLGDVAIATQERYIHCGVQSDSLENDPLPFDLMDQAPLSRKGIYPFDPEQVDHAHAHLFQAFANQETRLAKGSFITVSSITASKKQASLLYGVFSPVMEAMEGAACAHIAGLYGVPVIEVRSASNFVGQRDKTKWNMDQAIEQLGTVCFSFF